MAPPAPTRRWIAWALVASLALNLLVAGLVIGAILRGPPDRVIGGPGLWRYAHALPDPHRRNLGRELRASRGDWTGQRETLRGKREALAAALRADPFDINAVEAVLADERRLADDLVERGNGLLLAQIAEMSAEARASYADAILRSRRPPRERSP